MKHQILFNQEGHKALGTTDCKATSKSMGTSAYALWEEKKKTRKKDPSEAVKHNGNRYIQKSGNHNMNLIKNF